MIQHLQMSLQSGSISISGPIGQTPIYQLTNICRALESLKHSLHYLQLNFTVSWPTGLFLKTISESEITVTNNKMLSVFLNKHSFLYLQLNFAFHIRHQFLPDV